METNNQVPILIDKNFPQPIVEQVVAVATKLNAIPAITSQEIHTAANSVLKEAKQLIKLVKAQGLVMRKPVSDLANEIMAREREILLPIESLAQTISDNLTKYSIKVEADAKTEKDKIEEEAREKVLKEEIRITAIQKKIEAVRVYGLGEVLNCKTVDDVELLKGRLNSLKFNVEQYAEFTDEANLVKDNLILSMDDKIAKIQAGLLEQSNKELSEQKDLAEKTAESNIEGAVQDVIANIQMESDLKTSQVATASGIQKRWKLTAITDMSLVPIQYLCVNEKLVAQAIKDGIYEIPGLKIEQVISTVSR